MQHHIIYVPGLADNGIRKYGQTLLIHAWQKRHKISTSYYSVGWGNKDIPFAKKLQGLLGVIDTFTNQGKTVSLVGSSAGAAIVIHALAKRRSTLHKVVVICGALGPVTAISQHIRQAYPAFKTASQQLPAALSDIPTTHRRRILSIIPLSDRMVKVEYMHIPGAHHTTQHTHGHLWSITASLLLRRFSKPIVDFVRK